MIKVTTMMIERAHIRTASKMSFELQEKTTVRME